MQHPAVPEIEATRRWISAFVIGLNLCPFARRVFDADKIRYVVTPAVDARSLLTALDAELSEIIGVARTEIETTLLIHPHVFGDFLDHNDFLEDAEKLIRKRRLEGIIQIASFHPQYQFAGTEPDAAENYTNRSPYPMLHLLREASVAEVVNDPDEGLAIAEANIATMNALGAEKILAMLQELKESRP